LRKKKGSEHGERCNEPEKRKGRGERKRAGQVSKHIPGGGAWREKLSDCYCTSPEDAKKSIGLFINKRRPQTVRRGHCRKSCACGGRDGND